MIANASQVRIPCESPVPSRPVPIDTYSSIDSYVGTPVAIGASSATRWSAMDGGKQ